MPCRPPEVTLAPALGAETWNETAETSIRSASTARQLRPLYDEEAEDSYCRTATSEPGLKQDHFKHTNGEYVAFNALAWNTNATHYRPARTLPRECADAIVWLCNNGLHYPVVLRAIVLPRVH